MADEKIAQARNALTKFMSAMNQWETKLYRAKRNALDTGHDISSIDDEGRNSLIAILEKWTFSDKTNQGRLIDLGCTDPPSYDPESDIEESVEVENGMVVFVFRQTKGLQNKFRFTLKSQDVEWKIKKKELLNYREKWQRSVL
jgi:hypothetical protein